jgi:DNA invertase Pin-like site-specific DNA recombinase
MQDENADVVTIPAVAYIRVNEQAIGDSEAIAHRIQRQRVRCAMLADEHGLTVVRPYIERTGALPIHQRPELQRLLRELPALRVSYVVAGDLERVSRSARELVAIEQRLIGAGAELLVWGENETHAHLRRRMAVLLAEYEAGHAPAAREDRA